MEVKEYQGIIEKTAVYPKEIGLLYCALGLCGEAGEVAEKVKKLYRDNELLVHEFNMSKQLYGYSTVGEELIIEEQKFEDSKELTEFKHNLAKECSDALWYITAIANEIGYSLEDIMEINYKKLMARRETGTLHGSGDNREVEKIFKENELTSDQIFKNK